MSICAIVEQSSASDNKRKDERWRIRLDLPGSLDGPANVIIHDLSATGMRIETDARLRTGQVLVLALPDTEDITAHVVWRDDRLFGCRFEEPLSQSVVSATRLRSAAMGAGVEKEPLAARLLRLRRALGLSRAALSRRTGFSKPSLWAWETGKTMPRRANLLVLGDIFGLSEQQLLHGDEACSSEVSPEQDQDRPSAALRDAIDQARSRIASIAGVQASKVRISIDF